MIRILSILFAIIVLSCTNNSRDDITFDDFENGNFNNWEKHGVTFNIPTHKDSSYIKNVNGSYFAISDFRHPKSNVRKGKLISKPFIIERNFINLSVAGGSMHNRACINLVINNRIVKSANGQNDSLFRRIVWNVEEFIEKKAFIEIVDAMDNDNKSLGFIAVDNIIFSDNKSKSYVIYEDFESGNFNKWKISGTALKSPQNRVNSHFPMSVNGYNGSYFACSFTEDQDIPTGKLESEYFTIGHDFISVLVGGGNHPDHTCINLIINNTIVRNATGNNSENLRKIIWNTSALKGMQARIEIVDNYSGSWGNIMVDDIIFFNKKNYNSIYLLILILLVVIVIIFIKKHLFNNRIVQKLPDEKFIEFENKIITEKIFKDKSVNLKIIARSLSMKSNDLNELIIKSTGDNFYTYMNRLRVKEFISIINSYENKKLNITYVAEKCGFGSKASFYRIFKEITGESPTKYREGV